MLYEFKSKAGGTVVMTQEVGERLLAIIGKAAAAAGVFEPEHLPAAIRALQAAIDRERQAGPPPADDDPEAGEDPARRIGLAQRAWPLLELFKAAVAANQRVTWGV